MSYYIIFENGNCSWKHFTLSVAMRNYSLNLWKEIQIVTQK